MALTGRLLSIVGVVGACWLKAESYSIGANWTSTFDRRCCGSLLVESGSLFALALIGRLLSIVGVVGACWLKAESCSIGANWTSTFDRRCCGSLLVESGVL